MGDPIPYPIRTLHSKTYAAIDPTQSQLSSRGKNIVVTGGGRGIGPAIAASFAQSGAASIILLGRNESTLRSTQARLESLYPSTRFLSATADITDRPSLDKAFSSISPVIHGGKIHVLIANAGVNNNTSSIKDASSDDWTNAFTVNVMGNFHLVRAFTPYATSDASVINITSAVAHSPYVPGYSGYQCSKLAAAKMFEYVQMENPGWFVVNVHPGLVETDMGKSSGFVEMGVSYTDAAVVGNFCVWVVNPEARWMNGRFLWAAWDVNEIQAEREQILTKGLFKLGLYGFHNDNLTT